MRSSNASDRAVKVMLKVQLMIIGNVYNHLGILFTLLYTRHP